MNKRCFKMKKQIHRFKLYICSIIAILLAAILWLCYNHYYVPMKRTETILQLIEEKTHDSLIMAGRKLDGYETVRGKRQQIEDHQPLRGKHAEAVKQSLLNILSTTDDMEIIDETLSFFFASTSKPERSGIEISDEEEWRIIEDAVNKFNQSQKLKSKRRHYIIAVDDEGNKMMGMGSSMD